MEMWLVPYGMPSVVGDKAVCSCSRQTEDISAHGLVGRMCIAECAAVMSECCCSHTEQVGVMAGQPGHGPHNCPCT